jgi:hypothetical protein
MTNVKVKVAPVAWPLVAVTAILVAARYVNPTSVPGWLLLIPLALICIECFLVMPSSVLVAVVGVKGLKEQMKRLAKLSIYEEVLDKLADQQADKREESP